MSTPHKNEGVSFDQENDKQPLLIAPDSKQQIAKPERHHCHDTHDDHHHHSHNDNDNENDNSNDQEMKEETKLNLSEFYYDDLDELNLLHHHLTKLPDLSKWTHVTRLVIRQNLLPNLNGLNAMKNLLFLDCYLNSLESIDPCLLSMTQLQWLDLSFNGIRLIDNLQNLKNLKKLFLVNNKIKKIGDNLKLLGNDNCLEMLELGSNRIRVIENIDNLVNVTQLWLGKNKIKLLQNLENLVNLELLSIQSNRLQTIGNGLKYNVRLKELYLSHNGFQKMDEGLLFLVNLETLDMAGNFVTKIENLQNCKKLKEFWMNDNKIDTFEGFNCITSDVIETIYLERNPIQSQNPQKYKQQVLSAFPSLTQLDANPLIQRIRANKLEKNANITQNE